MATHSGLHHYRFTSIWDLPASPARVYEVLADPADYPLWWPEIREVRRTDAHSGVMRFRSLLPYELVVTAHEVLRDREAGVLAAHLTGDLEGSTRWTVTGRADGSAVAVFDEEVEVRKPLMRLLAPVARPAFGLNHAVMMRHGMTGLARYLAVCPMPRIGLDQ